ncbi:MAG: hypothetical protein A3F90_06550 [Deltaproteobacteria bacterium RIFCSPLOWO2_12_FULL_60_19]|nr:MAG: hypothetical protein A3F90_06550 [Deltaproteobacteria bacterium RIFCSPLOWO2_12_FULL_60_19]
MADRAICIHGHFYQPPREDPWTGRVEQQISAAPFHDWNARISAECYAPNTASPILGAGDQVIKTVNNYAAMSFNFGPTLLSWLERRRPAVYRAILEGDRLSRGRYSGHGSAIAQVYNHMIMPLAGRRDKKTQTVWGVKDFERRFGRQPEGMWLPETAVDIETLEVLAEAGIKFTILAPHQAQRVREIGGGEWRDVSGGKIDPTEAYLCSLPSGRVMSLFFYDGQLALDVAFRDVLNNGEHFAGRLQRAFRDEKDRPQIVHIATDGETYGHYRAHGDMALAYCFHAIERDGLGRLTNYGEYLANHPPAREVEIVERSSWSCAHGVERWRADCGCGSGMHPGWTQAWRKPLREAMDWLRARLGAIYEEEARPYFRDPWEARDDYIELLLDRSADTARRLLKRHALRKLTREERQKVFKLMEMEKHGMLGYTSCGWFFDDISGIETVQVMRYAARAMELAQELRGIELEPEYVRLLESAPSNAYGDGARVYELLVRPSRASRAG